MKEYEYELRMQQLTMRPHPISLILLFILCFAQQGMKIASALAATDPYQEGMRLFNQHQERAAIGYFNRAIAANPRHAEAFVGRGLARHALREYALALEDFSAAINLKPRDEEAYIYRGKTYRALRQPERAIDDFDTAIRVKPDSGKGYFERANTHQIFSPNLPATALKDFDEAIRREPKNAIYYNRRGGLLTETDNFDRAIGDFNRAIAIDPTMALAYGNRGMAKFFLNRKDEAAEDFRKCLVLAPNLKPWLENQVRIIPQVKEWQTEFRRRLAEAATAASSSGDPCMKYSSGARISNCWNHGMLDTESKISNGTLR